MALMRIIVSTRFDWSPHTSRFTVRMPTSTHDIFTERVVQEVASQLKSVARRDTDIAAVLDLVRSESISDGVQEEHPDTLRSMHVLAIRRRCS